MRVRYHLLTRNLFCWLICFGLLSLNGVASAQVYKSYDADGNVIFSDKPTPRSQEVDITEPNLSDSFEMPPPPPAEPPSEIKPESEPEPEPEPVTQPIEDYDSADTNKDGRVSRREKEAERKERRKKKREEEKAAEGN